MFLRGVCLRYLAYPVNFFLLSFFHESSSTLLFDLGFDTEVTQITNLVASMRRSLTMLPLKRSLTLCYQANHSKLGRVGGRAEEGSMEVSSSLFNLARFELILLPRCRMRSI